VTGTKASLRLTPWASAAVATCALAVAVCLLLPAPWREPSIYGALAASLGAACGLAALAASIGRGMNGLLAGFSIGFLCRMVLVAAGLFASGARGNLALAYTAAFFAVYAATQLIEVLFVHASSKRLGATP
jgi:hypothetical protein